MKALMLVMLAGLCCGCGSVKVQNITTAPKDIYMGKAAQLDDGSYSCSSVPLVMTGLGGGQTTTFSGLTQGRYCVNGYQVDVPLLGEVAVLLR